MVDSKKIILFQFKLITKPLQTITKSLLFRD